MHVLIIPSEHFVTPKRPLAGIFQRHQADALHLAGHQVGVIGAGIASLRFLLSGYPYDEFEDSHGYPVFRRYVRRVLPERWRSPESRVAVDRRLGRALLREYVDRYGLPDVIHGHNLKVGGMIARTLSSDTGVPYVVTEHSSEFLREDATLLSPDLLRDVVHGARAVTAVSSSLGAAMERYLSIEGIGVLPNVVEPRFLEQPLGPPPNRGGRTVFLNIAGLNANKNHALLIRAFAERFRDGSGVLRIAGSGSLAAELKELTHRLDVTSQVSFLSRLSRDEILEELETAHAVVLSSYHETFGVVLIEALARGRPVISTRCGGPEDFVNEECGMLVDRESVADLGEAMERMHRTRGDYEPGELREYCRREFGPRAFAEKAESLYRTAIAGGEVRNP